MVQLSECIEKLSHALLCPLQACHLRVGIFSQDNTGECSIRHVLLITQCVCVERTCMGMKE